MFASVALGSCKRVLVLAGLGAVFHIVVVAATKGVALMTSWLICNKKASKLPAEVNVFVPKVALCANAPPTKHFPLATQMLLVAS